MVTEAAAAPPILIFSLGVVVVEVVDGTGAFGLFALALRFGIVPSRNEEALLPVEDLRSGMPDSSSGGGKVKSKPRKSRT